MEPHRFARVLAAAGAGLVMCAFAVPAAAQTGAFEGPVPRAVCGAGSRPEPALQGEVTKADRISGRSAHGYTCNLALVGTYGPKQGFEGAAWQLAWYGDCAYYNTAVAGTQKRRGTVVVDVRDPARPRFSTNLTTIGMLDPWESLKANGRRGLLASVYTAGSFDVYDVRKDCAHPKLAASASVDALGHEGLWSPDGRTYYSTGFTAGTVTAIDVSNPEAPRTLTTFVPRATIHGFGISPDGKRMYLAHVNEDYLQPVLTGRRSLTDDNGLGIYDVSEIQERRPDPQVRRLGQVNWMDGSIGQHALPFTLRGHRYVAFVDEFGHGGPRIIDVNDERHPRVVSKLKLQIQMPDHAALAQSETERPGAENGGGGGVLKGGYNSHYCNVDSAVNPTILACSNFQSGLRVFDIRRPRHPREIAYYNAGGDGTKMPASFGGTYSGYASAQPRIIRERGEIWFTDQDRGLMVVRFTNHAWPIRR
jgi:hypothetical protein